MAISWLLAFVVAATPTDQQVRELLAAARTGDLQTVTNLVEGGVPAGAEHSRGMAALMASPAVSEGILSIRTPTRLAAIGSKGAAGDE